MARSTAVILAGLLLLGAPAGAQEEVGDNTAFLESGADKLAARRPPNISTELISVEGLSRFHLTTRMTPGMPDDAFSDDLRWTFVPAAHIRIRRGMTLDATLPMGAFIPSPGENSFILGNLSVGVSGGGHIYLGTPHPDRTTLRLGLGGAFDLLAPTASATGEDFCQVALEVCDRVSSVRNLHAYRPEMYVDGAMFVRARFHAELSVSVFTAELELALTPGVDITKDPEARFLMLVGWAARASVKAGPYVEPYLELANAQHVAGKNQIINAAPDLTITSITGRDLSTPVMVTLGLRGHFRNFDPALFASIDASDGLVIFGLDLAGALRPTPRRGDETRDFLRGPGDDDPWD